MRNVSRAIEFIVNALLKSMAAEPVLRMFWRTDMPAGRMKKTHIVSSIEPCEEL
jgi:hypothetical protein